MQLETMAKLKGGGSRQRITVRKYSQHEHKHIHLHQGGNENGNQPQGPREARTAEINAAVEPPKLPAVSGDHAAKNCLSKPGGQREDAVPAARRSGAVRGS
jgi:hypothetical protein